MVATLVLNELNTGTKNETFQQSGKQILSDIYWRVQLVCVKVQSHSSLEPPLGYNQDQMLLTVQGWLWPTRLGGK